MELSLATTRQGHIVYDLLVAALIAGKMSPRRAEQRALERMEKELDQLLKTSPLYGFVVLAGEANKPGVNRFVYNVADGINAAIYGTIAVRRVIDKEGNLALEFQNLYVVAGSPKETASTLMVFAAERAAELYPDAPNIWIGVWDRPGHWKRLGFTAFGTQDGAIAMRAPLQDALARARRLRKKTMSYG